MARARKARLTRMTGEVTRATSATSGDRQTVGAWAAVCGLIRERLAQAGIDPAGIGALRLAPQPDPLAAGGAKERFEGFALLDGDGLAGTFAAKIGDLAQRYEGGGEPDFANASLAELFAWCVSRGRIGQGVDPLAKPASDDKPRMNHNEED